MKKPFQIALLTILSLSLVQCSKDENTEPDTIPRETATDADGNVYQTIEMGDQVWMLENLKTTTYNDGSQINEWTPGVDWYNGNDSLDYFQWASTADLNNVYPEELEFDHYGAVYNHFALGSGKLAPTGWRIPSQSDFIELENFLASKGHEGNEATALKSTFGWIASSGNGTDIYGFNGLPNGYVTVFGTSTATELICTWATSDINTTDQTRMVVNLFDADSISYFGNGISLGAGVRCIKE